MGHKKITNLDSQIPLGGIDFDTEESAISAQDARDFLNCRYTVSYEGRINCITNLKGNVLVPFDYGIDKHRCIGSCEDTKSRTIIFFLWCSDSNKHKIMRWHRTVTSSTAPYGFIEKLTEFPFGWNQKTKITGVNLVVDNDSELLKWTDPRPRAVDVAKLSVLNKTRCWKLYLPKTEVFTEQTAFVVSALDINGNVIIPLNQTRVDIFIPAGTTNSDALKLFADIASAVPNIVFTSTACDCHLEICTNDDRVQKIDFDVQNLTTTFPTWVVPDNWYGVDLIDQMFEAGDYPSQCQPEAEFARDDNANYNYIENVQWQFRTVYNYFDFSRSVYSPFSQIPLGNIVCNEALVQKLNYVDVNFNDARLLDPRVLTLIDSVGVCIRAGNAGVEKLVEKVEPCDFLDMDENFNPIAHYKFYNTIAPKALPPDDVTQHFDSIPLTAPAQEYFRDRLVYGGITEGYNKPDCVDIQLTPNISETVSPPVYKVTVRIRIYNPFLSFIGGHNIPGSKSTTLYTADPSSLRGGIFIDYDTDPDPNNTFYGGGCLVGVPQTFEITAGMETKYRQLVPEGGWAVYAAGTNYFGISRQIETGLRDTKNGAVISSASARDSLTTYFSNLGGDIYSEAVLYLPDGHYSLRLPSSWCSFGDKLGYGKVYDLNNGTFWHKTSTNIWGVKYPAGNFTLGKELNIQVNGADLYAGDFVIRDMAQKEDTTDDTFVYCGYLLDNLGDVGSDELKIGGIGVEKSYVVLNNSNFANLTCFTDHNGYFYAFGTDSVAFNFNAYQVNNPAGSPPKLIATTTTSTTALAGVYFGSLQALYDGTLTVKATSSTTIEEMIWATNTPTARAECSTVIKGVVKDITNTPVQGCVVVYQGGRIAVTDQNGEYRIIAFGNLSGVGNVMVNDNNRILDSIIFYEPASCFPVYGTPIVFIIITEFGANAGVVPPPFSPTAQYDVGQSLVDFNAPPIYKSRKRGGSYTIGIVYYDNLLRQTGVAQLPTLYIPFTTEDLHQYVPALPAGTYKQGIAQIDFQISSSPPQFASFYQFVISRDKNDQTYLTWAIKKPIYIIGGEPITVDGVTTFDYIETTFKNGDATLILLDISNINEYAKQNFDTNVSYTWQQGDRVRLISNNRVYYQGLFDFEVISFEQPAYLVIRNTFAIGELTDGAVIQVYRPRPLTEEEILFEFGNCFPCTNPGHSDNAHSVTSGTMTGGDTYFRNRDIPIYNDFSADLVQTYMECDSISDFWDSTSIDIGRIQVDSPAFGEKYRPALMRASDRFQPDTEVNGLSRFRDVVAARKELERKDGLIISLKTPDIVLQATQQSAITSVYIERTIIRDAQEQEVMATTTDYFGTDNRMQGDYGGEFADGVIERDAYIYGVDTTRGVSWRRADNGLQRISDYKAKNYFGKYRERPIWDVCAVFDGFMKEYIVTIWDKASVVMREFRSPDGKLNLLYQGTPISPLDINLFDTVQIKYTNTEGLEVIIDTTVTGTSTSDPTNFTITVEFDGTITVGASVTLFYRGDADTIAFSEAITPEGRKNRWVTRYSFHPEHYESVGDEFCSWSEGGLWIHDKNTVRNNFYGVQYPMRAVPVFNASQDIKEWFSFFIDTIQDNNSYNGICSWSSPAISNKNGQLSRINNASFQKKEEFWHTQYPRDLTTLVANPIVNGRLLRYSQLRVELENAYDGEVQLRSVNSLVEISERNTK